MDYEALLEQYLSDKSDKETWVRTVVGIFIEHNVTQPTEDDYKDMLKTGLRDKGIKGKSSYYNYKKAGEEFYEWLSKKGDKTVKDIETINETEHVEVKEAEADTDMANSNEPKEPELKKRRRKKQPENENRTQISAYLSNEVYAGVKALATVSQQTISDIVSRVMREFYENNQEAIQESIRIIERYKSVELKIKYGN